MKFQFVKRHKKLSEMLNAFNHWLHYSKDLDITTGLVFWSIIFTVCIGQLIAVAFAKTEKRIRIAINEAITKHLELELS